MHHFLPDLPYQNYDDAVTFTEKGNKCFVAEEEQEKEQLAKLLSFLFKTPVGG